MESWCFDSADKFYSSNETVSSCNSIPRTKNVLKGFKFNDPFIYQTNLLIPNQQIASANPSFSQVALPEISNAQLPNLEETNIVNPCVITPDTISGEDESSLKLSSSIMNSKIHESCQFDLKLGAFSTKPSSNSSKSPPISSPLESSMPLKKAYCQVYGCGKDLSSAREYYKRHRVCEAHSKTSMVIVNGIKQRFCQQCSRFHLVSEFDDSKRSCRKRLTGHNERRRKPQVGYNSSRNGRSVHSFSASFTSHKSNGFTGIERYKQMNDWGGHLNVEDGAEYVEKSEVTCINEDPHQKAIILASSDCGNKCPCFMSKRNKCVRNEHLTVFDEASNGEVLGSISLSDPGVALSLLSRGSPYYGKPACSDLGSQIPHPSL